MSTDQMNAMKWFFCFRQTNPAPPDRWVAQGPYDSYGQAKAKREAADAWDAEVCMPFEASTKAEAHAKCDTDQTF